MELLSPAEYPEPFWRPGGVSAAAWDGRLPNAYSLLARRGQHRQFVRTFIFVAGAPGAGKSTVAAIQRRLGTPLFEFGWIPEFRNTHRQHVAAGLRRPVAH
jgi:hypothetical protein